MVRNIEAKCFVYACIAFAIKRVIESGLFLLDFPREQFLFRMRNSVAILWNQVVYGEATLSNSTEIWFI